MNLGERRFETLKVGAYSQGSSLGNKSGTTKYETRTAMTHHSSVLGSWTVSLIIKIALIYRLKMPHIKGLFRRLAIGLLYPLPDSAFWSKRGAPICSEHFRGSQLETVQTSANDVRDKSSRSRGQH